MVALADGCPGLESLDLSTSTMMMSSSSTGRSSIGDTTLMKLGGMSNSQLRVLNFSCCYSITDTGIAALAAGCPLLEKLHVSHCINITDVGFSHLAACPRLQDFEANWCDAFGDVSLESLSKRCPELRLLSLVRCGRLTDAGIAHLFRCRRLRVLNLNRNMALTDTGFEGMCEPTVERPRWMHRAGEA